MLFVNVIRFAAAVLLGRLYVFGGQGNVVGQKDTPGSYFPISAQVERFDEVRVSFLSCNACVARCTTATTQEHDPKSVFKLPTFSRLR
jgi:hypothetical protein